MAPKICRNCGNSEMSMEHFTKCTQATQSSHPQESWEKIEKEIGRIKMLHRDVINLDEGGIERHSVEDTDNALDDLLSMFKSLLTSHKAEMIEKLEGKEREHILDTEDFNASSAEYDDGYNNALSDAIEIIKGNNA